MGNNYVRNTKIPATEEKILAENNYSKYSKFNLGKVILCKLKFILLYYLIW